MPKQPPLASAAVRMAFVAATLAVNVALAAFIGVLAEAPTSSAGQTPAHAAASATGPRS